MPAILMVCYLIVAVMHLICGVSLINCRFLLVGLRKMVSLSAPFHPDPEYRKFQSDIPRNVEAILTFLDLAPSTKAYICCPLCFCLYDHHSGKAGNTTFRCSFSKTPTSPPCNAKLWNKPPESKGAKPVRLFYYHELEEWIGRMYCRPDMEAFLDRDFGSRRQHSDADATWDIWDAPELQEFLGPEGDPSRPFLM